jgi:hypothetical protein
MRSDKELIQLLLDSEDVFVNEKRFGLCSLVWKFKHNGIITNEESVILATIIYDHLPETTYNSSLFFFPPHQWQPRKEFLELILEKL